MFKYCSTSPSSNEKRLRSEWHRAVSDKCRLSRLAALPLQTIDWCHSCSAFTTTDCYQLYIKT